MAVESVLALLHCSADAALDVGMLLLRSAHLGAYADDHTPQAAATFVAAYVFMQTFALPGTAFLALLAGSLFGQVRGVALVVCTATLGSSSSYLLSCLVSRPLVAWLWPGRLEAFRMQVKQRRASLLYYMLFLRVTPAFPNTFINVASPIVDVPYPIFAIGTFFGLMPGAFVAVRAGSTIADIQSVSDLYDTQTLATLLVIAVVSIAPTLLAKKEEVSKEGSDSKSE
eukprot:SM000171S03214  [mRNA]  locus=s171:22522:23840:+ [translate_table: standard]